MSYVYVYISRHVYIYRFEILKGHLSNFSTFVNDKHKPCLQFKLYLSYIHSWNGVEGYGSRRQTQFQDNFLEEPKRTQENQKKQKNKK